MHLPPQVNNRLIHFKKQLLLLAKRKIFTVVVLCHLFCISRNTFYKYRRRQFEGNLGYISSAPISHGRKKGKGVVDAVLAARERFPAYGKRRIAQYLNSQGISICANTVQSILKAHNKALPKVKRKKRTWRSFEAIAPNVLWSIDICYLYTQKRHGFSLYLITILDDHSRYVVASGIFEQATIKEVVLVLKDAVTKVGVPQTLVCDNGSQFTCSEFKRVCKTIKLTIDYAPRHYPQYKGKLERFFRTTREEMERGETIEDAITCHDDWIHWYNLERIHSSVTDVHGKAHCPLFRFTWKQSLASPVDCEVDVDAVFKVKCIPSSHNTRKVNAKGQISYRKQLYTFEQLNKGDIVSIKENKEALSFYVAVRLRPCGRNAFRYQEQLLMTCEKPPLAAAVDVRKVKSDGRVKFHNQYYQLENIPKGTVVLITKVDGKLHFSVNGELLLVAEGQIGVQQPI